MNDLEIERKFLIQYPSSELLESCADATEIEQTYLLSEEKSFSDRVRKRGTPGRYVYTHTRKRHITDLRRVELESEITEEEYQELLLRSDPERNVVYKKRYCLDYEGQRFEIDVYPFWRDRAIMELELENEDQKIVFPESITIIKDVTDDKRYTNASIARSIPFDEL